MILFYILKERLQALNIYCIELVLAILVTRSQFYLCTNYISDTNHQE